MNQRNNSVQTRDATPTAIVAVNQLFDKHKKAIEDALPRHMTADRMIRIALTELRKTPKLQMCDPLSFMGAIVQAAQLGLEPGGALGHCYLIPYGKEVQLQIGYRGMVDMARRSGNIVSISARCIYEGDHWSVEFGTEEKLTHSPSFQSDVTTHVYAVAKLKDGGTQFEIMTRSQVEYIRDTYSSGFKNNPRSSPWTSEFDEMAKKTLVRRLFKMLPTSIEIMEAIRVDEDDAQQNAKVIDRNYEVPLPVHDPAKYASLANGSDQPYQPSAAMDADRKLAIEEFEKAAVSVRRRNADPEQVLGEPINDVLMKDAATIQSRTDILRDWGAQA